MNPVELYKQLPKKNCGDCAQKTCMAFAMAALRGETDLSGCPHLDGEALQALKGSLTTSDWREELAGKLREEVRQVDFPRIAEGLGARLQGGSLVLTCLGREFTVTADGVIVTKGPMTPWIKILLLHYIRTAGREKLSGKWVSYAELKSGMVKATSFARECEEPLRELFDRDAEQAASSLLRMGAEQRGDFPTSCAWRLLLLPKLPVMVLYWPPDEEFPSKLSILFDATADRFLDAESLIFLLEGLVKNVERNFIS